MLGIFETALTAAAAKVKNAIIPCKCRRRRSSPARQLMQVKVLSIKF